MDETPTRWSFRDIFLSLGIAADPAILALSFLGLSAGSVAYGFFFFLGSATGEPTALSIFAILGGIVFIVMWILTSGILARMVVVRLLEGRQAAADEVQEYLAHRAGTLLLIPATFAVVVLVALGGLGVLEITGRLPGLGPIVFGAAFSLAFLLSLIAVLAFILHTLGGLLYPAILATRKGGLIEVVTEILELARQKGPLLVVYSLVILMAGGAAALFIGSIASVALALTTSSAHGIMGAPFADMLAGLPSMFRPFLEMFESALGPVPMDVDVAWHYDLGGFLVGLSLLTIFAACLAYPFALVNSAGAIAYFILTTQPLPAQAPLPGMPDDGEPDDGEVPIEQDDLFSDSLDSDDELF
jgi:hypothetical protein